MSVVTAHVRETLTAIVEAMEQLQQPRPSQHYLCAYDFVLREGTDFVDRVPFDPAEWGNYVPEEHACFSNAFDLAIYKPGDLTYVEGYASTGLFPVEHAWCRTADGRVLDPTWDTFCPDLEERSYLGVPFDLRFALLAMERAGHTGIIDDWENNWPLLQTPLNRDEACA